MKVITIKQPWATLIAEGLKEYEFRTWKTKYRGEVLIQAGKKIDSAAMERFKKYDFDYPLGCIIAKANITDCVTVDDNFRNALKRHDKDVYHNIIDYPDWNGYGFKLENVKKTKHIYISGQLGLWNAEIDFK